MIEYIKKKSAQAAKEMDAYGAGTWVCVTSPTREELDILADKFQLDQGNLSDALDRDEVPRIERDNNFGYVFLRYAHLQGNGAPTTAPMLLILNNKTLITISATKPLCFDKICSNQHGLSTDNSTDLFLEILQHIFDDYDFYIKGISHKIQKIITKMRTHKLENEDFVSFVMIEDQLSNFLGALTPMPAILRRSMVSRHTALTTGQSDMVDDILLGIEQSINSCNSNAGRIVSIREAYSTLSNNSLNRSMKALTAATLIIALPNVVFGMYGMNIPLPLQHYWWAYPAIITGTAILVLLIALFAKKKRLF